MVLTLRLGSGTGVIFRKVKTRRARVGAVWSKERFLLHLPRKCPLTTRTIRTLWNLRRKCRMAGCPLSRILRSPASKPAPPAGSPSATFDFFGSFSAVEGGRVVSPLRPIRPVLNGWVITIPPRRNFEIQRRGGLATCDMRNRGIALCEAASGKGEIQSREWRASRRAKCG